MLKIFGRIFALLALVTTLGVAVGCGDDTENKVDAADAKTDLGTDTAGDATGN